MKIAHVDIQNFRKLKNCRVEFAEKSTIFVGANNSGKTSAMDALIKFLKKSERKKIVTTDVTLSNWSKINDIANNWITDYESDKHPNLSYNLWRPLLPTIDIWLNVEESQIHYISHVIPSLDWDCGLLGVRLILEPKDTEELYKAYKTTYSKAKRALGSFKPEGKADPASKLALWPTSMRDFLDKKLHAFFSITSYILDPKYADNHNPQLFTELMDPFEGDPFDGLFKIDIINAQRGFSDPNSTESTTNNDRRLSSQLRDYYNKHLNPSELPDQNDIKALETMEAARTAFDERLAESLKKSIGELKDLNYPGFSDPEISLSSKVDPVEGLNHDSAVQFKIKCSNDSSGHDLILPEQYNGLGYRNLISMIFMLIRFQDEWMQTGKVGKREDGSCKAIEPLHLILIEEPEAHLHAQVQQVFIKKAYDVLRNHSELREKTQFTTQMIVSTHSSYIAHETNFTALRYFHRDRDKSKEELPCASVVNMTPTFGDQDETSRFATRYLKTTHCDLFFADAVILVEGPVERMLIPYFIRGHYSDLDRNYISLLEIGGSHAHKLDKLIEALGIPTLVITDLDSIENREAYDLYLISDKNEITTELLLSNKDMYSAAILRIGSNLNYTYTIYTGNKNETNSLINFTEDDRRFLDFMQKTDVKEHFGNKNPYNGKHEQEIKKILKNIIQSKGGYAHKKSKKVRPLTGHNYLTGNDTLKKWVLEETDLDKILKVKPENKITSNGMVRVAYPCATSVEYNSSKPMQVIPYTFEDALVLDNIATFKSLTKTAGLTKKMVNAIKKPKLDEACEAMFNALD